MPCQSNSSAGSAALEQAQHERERGDLGGAADHQRDGRRRPVVHVGDPHVIRHGAQLERDRRHDEHEAEQQDHPVALPRQDRARDLLEVERAGSAVDHRHAVQQHSRGERAQHEVLHRGFGSALRAPVHRHQRIQRQRLQLEPHVEREEIGGGDHHHHAEQREQRQHERLAAEEPSRRQVVAREEERERHRGIGEELEQVGQHVVDDKPVHRPDRLVAGSHDGDRRAGEECQLREPVARPFLGLRQEQVEDQDDAGRGEQDDLGQHREKAWYRHCRTRCHSLLRATCVSRSATDECITSISGFG